MWVLRNESTDELIVLSFPVICFQQKHKEWPNHQLTDQHTTFVVNPQGLSDNVSTDFLQLPTSFIVENS